MRVHPSESRAIERLGAKFDGVLRHHERMKGGTIRDTCDITGWETCSRFLGRSRLASFISCPLWPSTF